MTQFMSREVGGNKNIPGLKFSDIHPEHKHTQADRALASGGGDPDLATAYPGAPDEVSGAKRGQRDSTHGLQDTGSFKRTNGMHSVGSDHVGVFARSINMSGGARQGPSWVSAPAPGAARAGVQDNHLDLHAQGQGSGETFEQRQHRRWSGHGG